MSFLTRMALVSALAALVAADFPLDFEASVYRIDTDDPAVYRLPEDLDPIHIDFEMTPYLESEGTNAAFTFDGIVVLQVRATRNISRLIIQENVRHITGVSLTEDDGTPVLLDDILPFERLRQYHFLRINLQDGTSLVEGNVYRLRVDYIGNINETPLSRGIFSGSYRDSNGTLHWYVTSHLQPTNSRQAFPCLDEPGFKSTFDIVVNRPAHFVDTFSNMPIASRQQIGNRVREVFQRTPRMSAYLVTVHISDEFEVIAESADLNRPYRVLARAAARGQGQYALEVGPPITQWLEDYLGIPYYTMGQDMKNDQIAAPAWASGATENWGLVSYRELRLLVEEGETSAIDRLSVGTIVAHELAHKWFGNLVTARWWDNVWVNEGFASYFEYFAMHGVYPSMELEDQFIIMYLQSALSADAGAGTRALQTTVNSPTQVTGHFSGISYSKGASLLLMMKHFLTENTFRKALNYFLDNRSYQYAFPSDLYEAFSRAVEEDGSLSQFNNLDIAAILRYWVEQPGFPIINVQVDHATGRVDIQQERFFISATASPTEQAWPIPLTYTTGDSPNWSNLLPSHVMTGRTYSFDKAPGEEWVIFNVQEKGIYRVNYDTRNWELLGEALRNNFSSIHHLNRAQIVDDVFALMRSERLPFALGFQVLDFLKQDTSFYSWYPAISGFNWLRNRLLHLPSQLAEFDAILHEFLSATVSSVGYSVTPGEPVTTTQHRFYSLAFACNVGHEGCVADAESRYSAFRDNGVSVDPNVRRHVFCRGLLAGSAADWRAMRSRRANSNNQADEVAMLRALGCTTQPDAVNEYLEMILTEEVRAQDRLNAFTFLCMGNRGNARLVLDFLKTRLDDVREAMVLPAWSTSVLTNLAGYLDEEGLDDMEQWLTEESSIPEASAGLSAVASARTSQQWGTERADIILAAARGSAVVVLPTLLVLLAAIVAILQ